MAINSASDRAALPAVLPAASSMRVFRLIDHCCEPHRQLDSHYDTLEEAIGDAIAWLEPLLQSQAHPSQIGVEVRAANGDWRTCRLPRDWFTPLLCTLSP